MDRHGVYSTWLEPLEEEYVSEFFVYKLSGIPMQYVNKKRAIKQVKNRKFEKK